MIAVPGNVRVWLATGHTDMRRGFPSLARLVQEILKRDPHAGDLYVLGGRRGDLRSFGMMARARVCSRSGWSAAASAASVLRTTKPNERCEVWRLKKEDAGGNRAAAVIRQSRPAR
jgi:transposase